MCAVSAIGDDYSRRFPERWPNKPWDLNPPWKPEPYTLSIPSVPHVIPISDPVQAAKIAQLEADLKKLREEVEEMKRILIVAKEYDVRNNEPNCEMDEKVALLKKIAEYVGVDLSDVFPNG